MYDEWQQFFGCDDYAAWEELEAEVILSRFPA